MELIGQPLTANEFKALHQKFSGYFKVTVDIEKEPLVAGCELHVDGEELLLSKGSSNDNIWGGGVDPVNKNHRNDGGT